GYGIPRAGEGVILAEFDAECPSSGNCYASHAGTGCAVESCCFSVCGIDPYCCNNSWDGICANEGIDMCTTCGQASAGSCFFSGTASCDDTTCCDAVCTIDSYCCNNSWDSICVGEAWDLCIPENDDCGNAFSLTTGVPFFFSTMNATSNGPDQAGCDFFGN